jgi:hypothetical protein
MMRLQSWILLGQGLGFLDVYLWLALGIQDSVDLN